ncbi:uncharacterized protein K02A2.6-like [Coccinella septempunctata]|uniref:uncharacterized protein K02A2.6-like n=1 Tax=Coccinella septempunctata TaxID=41139 RepID=UPI001D069037|nr:uncharacterized protein K02A2.6-like [Coccinella septempunctata]
MPSTNEGQGTSKNASSVGNLREFHLNITDWNIYKARLNNYFSANEISDTNKQRAILLNMLDEEAYKLIFNICSPDLPEDKSYNSLLELFDKHFTPKKSVLAERYKFFAAKKDSYENIKEWAARIRSLAVSCEFGQELDICLRDRFVCGFEKGAILDRLLEEKKEITFEQAINVAENKMAACQSYQISGLEIKSEPLHHIRKRNNKSDEGKRHQAEGHHPVQDRESCAVCGKQGHRKGVLYPVDYSEWGTPVVPVLKKNGSLRLCGDYKVTINPHIEVDQHPLPRIDDLFNCLQGGVKFSKLDLSDAYQQIGLDESSKELTTIVTHKGLYRYNRLTYGIASAPAKFQKIMESLFTGLEGVVVFLDDVLITGKDDNEHLERLRVVLTILKNSGLKVSRPKCKFFQDSIEYLGYIIDKEGLHTSESKTVAIKNAEAPTNVSELKSFLGMVNYYGRFIPNLSTILHPLYELLKKDKKWDWSDNCRKAFEQIKSFLASPRVLVHFDPLMKIKLTVDASPYGVAAVLSHILPTGIDRPIAFASRTLSNSEKNYSHIEKEGLAIIFAVLKFHQYLYANKFKLVTDNKALISIFGQHKPIPQFSANRLRRWAVILSNYQYEIEYVESKKNNADALSRLLKNHSENDTLSIEDKEVNYCNFLSNSDELPMNYNQIVRETKQDELIAKIIRLVKTGWPRYINDVDIKPFFSRRFEFSVVDNCLYWNHRIIIPSKLRSVFLKSLHQTHFGIVKMKNIARSHFWWPNLDKEIEDTVKKCHSCSRVAGNPPKVPLANWSWPKEVWERLHIDYLGPIAGKYYLIILDAHSKWPEVFETSSTNTEITIKILKQIFARFGLPVTLVSDNATYFKSSDFELFLTNNNISHKTIPPFHPQSNGAAENSVKLFKNSLKKAFVEGHPVDTNTVLCRFLLDYRTTKHCTTGETPAKIMFGRNIRTRFDAILYKPSSVLRNRVLEAQDRQKKYFKGNNHVQFLVGDTVLVKDYRDQNKPTWIKGIIQKKIGRVTFLVYIPELEKNRKRHLFIYLFIYLFT